MSKKRKSLLILLVALAVIGFTAIAVSAAPETVDLPGVNISIGGEGTSGDYVSNINY